MSGFAGAVVKLAKRTVFRLGYPLARVWWWAVPQSAEGTAVAAVSGNRVLVVRQSFRKGLGLVGGGLRPDERPAAGAARELAEETGLRLAPDRLHPEGSIKLVHECRRLRVHLFTVGFDEPPVLQLDGAEVIAADWMDTESLRRRPDLHPVLATWLSMRRTAPALATAAQEPSAGPPNGLQPSAMISAGHPREDPGAG
ncbi:MAG TPA: NUDIX hydrolase [Geminicoccus sp.]|jgi:8-oxo-dGTP pyrophosphatase MutT (NUDIX family)|uniref:NUDIX hydrolase n=1 Tax=Geminicoccus sp. TaxID=2024832 RepID=UPI002E3796B5|nr:NUDIX hydrolase [Geminicoccus sp.]HEX2526933.1 NUDIX hydrolase [Geminicoccus sp.]